MLDFHTHILPKMDDGSNSIEASLALLKMEEQQGVDTLVLTPHYYIQNEEPNTFFERRERSYQSLMEKYSGGIKLLKGCECHFYNGISKSDFIEEMCVENTNLLLLELPFFRKINLQEVIELNCRVQVVLAHIERYTDMYSKKELDECLKNGVYLQCNAEIFEKKMFKGILKEYFESGKIMFLGSDTHNLELRKPNLTKAYEFIEKNYSKDVLKKLDDRGKKKI